jgi:RepB DNA-primase from phage plasmid
VRPNRPTIQTNIAAEFLARCFAPGETIAVLLRRQPLPVTLQRILLLERALAPRYLGWLARENSTGANIYVAANPLRSGSRNRTKESVATIRHLYLDIDTDGEARLAALRASDLVPIPTAVLSTSPGKYQVLWRVEGFDFERQENTLKLLSIAFGGDRACTDCNRVLRLPGFLNCKYVPPCPVGVEYVNDSIWNPPSFLLGYLSAEATEFTRPLVSGEKHRKSTNSEQDWAWVLRELAIGKDAVKLTRELASLRSDKPKPLYYAQRTVDIASARLWLLDGISFGDVVTMLESRRRFEIPRTLCFARAHEIALTARRMITRTKIA